MRALRRTAALLVLAVIPACGELPVIVTNTAPSVLLTALVGTQTSIIPIDYTLTDAESSQITILVEFSLDGMTWTTATRSGGQGITNLSSSLGGTLHTFQWDSAVDGVGKGGSAESVTIRITPSDALPGTPDMTTFDVDNAVTVFRMNTSYIRDPHIWFGVTGFVPCSDITDTFAGTGSSPITIDPYGPITNGMNELTNVVLSSDKKPVGALDGNFDSSPLLLFRRFDPLGTGGVVEFAPGLCKTDGTVNTIAPGTVRTSATFTNVASGTLFTPFASSTKPYTPPITLPVGPGFVTDPVPYTLDFGALAIPLENYQIAATYSGTPTSLLVDGVAVGFLKKSVANTVLVNLGSLGNKPLSSFLPGGTSCCANPLDDTDTGPDAVSHGGWWFYINFTAAKLTVYTGP